MQWKKGRSAHGEIEEILRDERRVDIGVFRSFPRFWPWNSRRRNFCVVADIYRRRVERVRVGIFQRKIHICMRHDDVKCPGRRQDKSDGTSKRFEKKPSDASAICSTFRCWQTFRICASYRACVFAFLFLLALFLIRTNLMMMVMGSSKFDFLDISEFQNSNTNQWHYAVTNI